MDDPIEQEKDLFEEDMKSRQYICPVCGKQFYLPFYVSKSEYSYKIRVYDPKTRKSWERKCCSYTCYRKGSS